MSVQAEAQREKKYLRHSMCSDVLQICLNNYTHVGCHVPNIKARNHNFGGTVDHLSLIHPIACKYEETDSSPPGKRTSSGAAAHIGPLSSKGRLQSALPLRHPTQSGTDLSPMKSDRASVEKQLSYHSFFMTVHSCPSCCGLLLWHYIRLSWRMECHFQ